MAKKDKKSKDSKKARAAEKQKKNQGKADSKTKKIAKKSGDVEEDQNVDDILEQYAKEQEAFEAINIDVCKRPSKRLNPSMVANATTGKRELLLFGGEHTENSLSHFYNDLYSYSIDNDIWRKISSKNAPLPRSSHSMCAHPSGVVLMFGGEFSSPKQTTFYHYGDTWILDSDTKEWTKVDQKKGPSARSGHRLAVWKNYIVMFGGFRDLGATTTYLNDVWLFDISSYKWIQVEFPPNHIIPDARSGHSMIPCGDGVVIYGGYCKVKARKGLQKGKVLTDIWTLKMKSDPKAIRFERRRKQGFNPSPRVGCSLTYHKNRGIMFGGVYDIEENEEQIDSEFYNNLYSYQLETNRWYNLSLKPQRAKKQVQAKDKSRDDDLEDILNSILTKAKLNDNDDDDDEQSQADGEMSQIDKLRHQEELEEKDESVEYPVMNQLPHPRFNAATCVVDDYYYIFGGIFERGDQEFCLDSFYAINLSKLDGVKVFWEDLSELEEPHVDSDEEGESGDDEEDEEEDEEDDEKDENGEEQEEEEPEEEEEEEPEPEQEEFPDPRPWLPHPKPFETLRAFYVRAGANFLEWSISSNRDARGKHLKKAAFDLCEDRFWERREQVSVAEDHLEELGGVGEVVEKDNTKPTKRR